MYQMMQLSRQDCTDRCMRSKAERRLREFFGTARFSHPAPSTVTILAKHFKHLDLSYKPSIRPSRYGETIEGLQNRHAYALHRMILALDQDPRSPRAVIICTHAASMICIGRTLTGQVPSDMTEEDFRCGTCALSRFERRHSKTSTQGVGLWDEREPDAIPQLDWRDGKGVAGGWDCTVNGDCSFLRGGEERTW